MVLDDVETGWEEELNGNEETQSFSQQGIWREPNNQNRDQLQQQYKCIYAVNKLNIRLKTKLTFYQIVFIIKEYTGLEIQNEEQYNQLIKRTKGLTEKVKENIRKEINYYSNNTNKIVNSKVRELIESKLKNKLEEDRIKRIIEEFKDVDNLEMKYIRYYFNKNIIQQLMNYISKNYEVHFTTIDEYKLIIYRINNMIFKYLHEQDFVGLKRLPEEITLSSINKLQDLLANHNYFKLKNILHIKEFDINEIKIKAEQKIEYLKYIREMEKKKHEIDCHTWKRIVNNKVEQITNKQIDKKSNKNVSEFPSIQETFEFWNELYSKEGEVDQENEYLEDIRDWSGLALDLQPITQEEVDEAIKSVPNWKTAGEDEIQGYFVKYSRNTHQGLTKIFNDWIDNPESIPDEYLTGITYLVYKNQETTNPANYRPITCLNVITKVFTTILKKRIEKSMKRNMWAQQISENQLGNKEGSLGAKEGCLISELVQEQLTNQKRNYIEIYYDIKKAYDSVNHEWLIQTLNYFMAGERIINVIKSMMNRWTVRMQYDKETKIQPIHLRRGIIQGDSLSPLLFILYIDIISKKLNEEIEKITILDEWGNKFEVNHYFYMDDLKVIVEKVEQAKIAHQLVKEMTKALGFEINMKKCGISVHGNIKLPKCLSEIPRITQSNPYKYLGTPVSDKVIIRAAVLEQKKKVIEAMNTINKTESSSLNYIRRVKSKVIGALRYSFGTIDWPITDLEDINRIIRAKMTEGGIYGRGMSLPRLYISREQLGHGIPNVRDEYAKELIRIIARYIWSCNRNMEIILHSNNQIDNNFMKRIKKAMKGKITMEELYEITIEVQNNQGKNIDKLMEEIDKKLELFYINKWKEQKVAGSLRREFEKDCVDQVETGKVWKPLNIKRRAYFWLVRMQEGSTMNGTKRSQITGRIGDKFCKLCKNQIASNNHILLNCQLNRKKQIRKHDEVAQYIYHEVERKNNLQYSLEIPHLRKGAYVKLMWNTEVVPRSFGNFPKKPDIYTARGFNSTVYDVAIVADHNLNKAYINKVNKYTILGQKLKEIQGFINFQVIPVIISVNGLINRHTIEDLKREEIKIPWSKVVRDIIIKNMQDVIYYNKWNIGEVEHIDEEVNIAEDEEIE